MNAPVMVELEGETDPLEVITFYLFIFSVCNLIIPFLRFQFLKLFELMFINLQLCKLHLNPRITYRCVQWVSPFCLAEGGKCAGPVQYSLKFLWTVYLMAQSSTLVCVIHVIC